MPKFSREVRDITEEVKTLRREMRNARALILNMNRFTDWKKLLARTIR